MGTLFPKHVANNNIEVYKWDKLHKTVVLLNSFSHEKTQKHDTIKILYKVMLILHSAFPAAR
jgi:hypothetical protein